LPPDNGWKGLHLDGDPSLLKGDQERKDESLEGASKKEKSPENRKVK
jgi:hypothetical protein